MLEARVGRHPSIVHRQPEITRIRHPGPREVQGPASRAHDHLHLVDIVEIYHALERRGQRRHRAVALDQAGQGLQLRAGHQRLICLNVEHKAGSNRAVGLGDAIGTALMPSIGQNRPKSSPFNAFSQQWVIHREPEWIVGGLGGDPLGHPKHKRLALNWMQQLTREPRGLQTARHDDSEGGHAGVFEVASRGTTGFCVNL